MSVNTDWKIVAIYVVGKGVLDVSLHNSLDIVIALYVGLILSGISHTVVITEYWFIKMQLTSSHDVTFLCAVNTGIPEDKLIALN
jgi:hypothetical protein